MADIKTGDLFDASGYEELAQATHDLGHTVVLTNNREDDEQDGRARLFASYEYGEHETAGGAYDKALRCMVRRTLALSYSLADEAACPHCGGQRGAFVCSQCGKSNIG